MAIITGIIGAGNGVVENQKQDIWRTLKVIEPYQTPAVQFAFFSGKRMVKVTSKNGKYSWFETTYFPDNSTTIAAVTAVTGKLTVDATTVDNFAIFNKEDLVLIEELGKMGMVESTTSTSATIVNPDGTALADLTTGTNILIITSMNDEAALAREAKSVTEGEKFNWLTIMSETVSLTNREQAGDSYTDGLSMAEKVQLKLKEMKLQQEKLTLLSLSKGNNSANGAMVKSWGAGAMGTFVSNVSIYTTLTEAVFDAFLKKLVDNGSPYKTFYAGTNIYFAIQDIMKAKFGNIVGNQIIKDYGVKLSEYYYGPLTIKLERDPILKGINTDTLIAVDDQNFVGRYMQNDKHGSRRLRIDPNVAPRGADYDSTKILSDIGCQFMEETTGGILKK